MKQFNLDTWLQDKSRKVVTRDGKPIRIVCIDSPILHHPIVGFVECDLFTWTDDGKVIYGGKCEDKNDLLFADEEEKQQSIEIPFGAKDSEFVKDEYYIPEGCKARIEGNKVIIEKIKKEEELTEFESKLADLLVYNHPMDIESANSIAKRKSKILLDLARKEFQPDVDKELDKAYKTRDEVVYLEGYDQGKIDTLKNLLKWKKAAEDKDFDRHVLLLEDDRVVIASCVYKDEYYIELNDLRTLPKEE